MDAPFWILLNALQVGILLALALNYGVEALRRHHTPFGMLVLGGLMIGVRHALLVAGPLSGVPVATVDRWQSLWALTGFVLSIHALGLMVSRVVPPWMNRSLYAFLALFILRAALLAPGTALDLWALRVGLVCILLICAYTGITVIRAALQGHGVARSLSSGLISGVLMVAAEALLRLRLEQPVPLSGFAYMLLSLSMVSTWMRIRNEDLMERLERAERESAGWRALLPGPAYHLGEASSWMDRTFGPDWASRLADRMESEARTYRLHRAFPGTPFDQGWVEELPDAPRADLALLQGWSVGLGLDDQDNPDGIQRLLEDWGARVTRWGILPPRQGPFPSILLWSREPTILAVWREDELSRRRCRWIQVGGAEIEGPHARLERPITPQALHETLKGLLSLPTISPSATPQPGRRD